MVVPVRARGRALGAILVEKRGLLTLSHTDLDLLAAFANQAASALENARLWLGWSNVSERCPAAAQRRAGDHQQRAERTGGRIEYPGSTKRSAIKSVNLIKRI
jgi:hypothetical protein